MARNGLSCADVLLRNYSLTHSRFQALSMETTSICCRFCRFPFVGLLKFSVSTLIQTKEFIFFEYSMRRVIVIPSSCILTVVSSSSDCSITTFLVLGGITKNSDRPIKIENIELTITNNFNHML